MNNTSEDKTLDGILGTVTERYARRENESLPSEEELKQRFPTNEKDCRRYIKKARIGGSGSAAALKILKRVAVIALALISASFGALMLNGNVRAAVCETVIKRGNDDVRVSFVNPDAGKEPSGDISIHDVKIGYIPEGLSAKEQTIHSTLGGRIRMIMLGVDGVDYSNHPSFFTPFVSIDVTRSGDIDFGYSAGSFDLVRMTTVNGMDAFLVFFEFEDKGEKIEYGGLIFGDENITIRLDVHMLSKEELFKIAESISW